MTDLTRGANTTIAGDRVELAVGGVQPGAVDLMVFQLTEDGVVRSDADFVFFNQPASAEGAVRLTGADRVAVELGAVPAQIVTLAVAVTLDDAMAGSLAGIGGLGVTVTGPADSHLAPAAGLTTERAAILVELYRRNGAWKLRNISAGWAGGFADLVRQHGVEVDDEPAPAAPWVAPSAPPVHLPPPAQAPVAHLPPPVTHTPPVHLPPPVTQAPSIHLSPPAAAQPPVAQAPVPQPAATPGPDTGIRTVPGEQALSLQKRQTLDLRKAEVHKVLLTKGAQGERARIVLVMDKSGSMADEYKSGLVRRVIERMVPVAIQLDDDGALECFLYASKCAQLPDLRVEYLDRWLDDFVHITGTHHGINYRKLGYGNDETKIIEQLTSTLQPGTPPTLVLFFTDGGIYKDRQISQQLRDAATLPAFWQFVGIGRNNFGVLARLDTLTGRQVDNTGFFPVTDLDKIDDAELYRRLLSEFPDWLRAARAQGIVR